MKRSSILAITNGLLLLTACDRQVRADFYPELKAGTQAVFSLQVKNGAFEESGELTMRNAGDEKLEGKTSSKMVVGYSGKPLLDPVIVYRRKAAEGIYEIEGLHRDAGEYLALPTPIKAGQTWTVTTGTRTTHYSVEQLPVYETAAATYKNCIKINYTSQDSAGPSSGYSIRAPNVGEVKGHVENGSIVLEYVRKD